MDIREPSSMGIRVLSSTWSLEEIRITTAISHAYSSHTALQSAGSVGYVSARDLKFKIAVVQASISVRCTV